VRWPPFLPEQSSTPRVHNLNRLEIGQIQAHDRIYEPYGVEVRGVRLAPHERTAAALAITPTAELERGSRHTFDILQTIEKEELTHVVGGGRYVVVVEGERKRKHRPAVATSHDPDVELTSEELSRIEKESEHYRYVPPHARDLVEKREREQGKERD
jgi:hypothetical protein